MTSAKVKSRPKTHEITLSLSNWRSNEISFVLEPWGEVYPFGPEDEIIVVARGPSSGHPEIVFADDAVTVWGWTGSTIRLFKNQEELGVGRAERMPVPEFPLQEP